ncbi:MAG TPA: sigma-70 family RNA polymerase sigma factor [Candidatus Anammoximicrobium sp.]|nr:sigma-70 family RNA polymerase sigma factor [Candidatus Anammoximicrobium sp.]
MSNDPRDLINRCLAGDEAAMIDLVELYRDRVFRFCYRMLGQRQDAEDAAQETFVRVLRSLVTWDGRRDFEPWLLAIAGNRCRSLLAARKRRPATGLLAAEQLVDRSPDWHAMQTLAEEVQLALLRLRPEYREAFVLFHENQLSYDQIAAAIQRPLGTVRTRIHKARQQLMAQLRRRGVVGGRRHAVRAV